MKPFLKAVFAAERGLCLLHTLGIALVCVLGSWSASATTVVPLSISETVQQSDAMVVGTITSHESRWGDASHRWMQTDYTLAVEEVIYPSERGVPIQRTIVLTYWGGTIGGETQAVADIRVPVDGERLLLMLHSRWAEGGTTSPTVGFNHGFFSITGDEAGGKLVVKDAAGQPLASTSNGLMARGNAAAVLAGDTTVMYLPAFIGWLRANIDSIKAAPTAPKRLIDQNDPRLMKIFSKSPTVASGLAPNGGWMNVNSIAPAQGATGEMMPGVPAARATLDAAPSIAETAKVRTNGSPNSPYYASVHQAHLPIVVNNFPPSFTPWVPEDQYQMSKWNYYASQVFRVFTTPTGTYGWPDGVFDLAGWPSDADRQRVYGTSWYCGSGCITLGTTFLRFDSGGWIIEADIALNPAASWTLDDEWVFDGAPAYSFRQTMIHELGHMHGLEHSFNSLAIMNYLNPASYRVSSFPFADDAAGIRAEYPANAVGVTDLAVYLYSETGTCFDGTTYYNCVSEATYPSSVTAGASLTVNNYHVENVGTATITTPTIEWYLSSARTFGSSQYFYLGQSTYPSLPTFTYFNPSTVGRTFTVPANVPAGSYYLAAFIRNDAGPGQGSFPFGNNYAFSRQRISVIGLSVLQFSTGVQNVLESTGSVTVVVNRTGTANGSVSVSYATASGTASSGIDFIPQSGTLTWASGDSSARTFTIPILTDSLVEPTETFTVTLSSPSAGAVIGSPSTQSINIVTELFPVNCQLPVGWSIPGTAQAGWSVVNNDASEGTCSLKSNTITASQKAQIQFAGSFVAGNITFDRKVSSESGFDCFRFFVDGAQQAVGGTCAGAGGVGASGEVAWGPVSVAIPAGAHTLIWSYEKDSSVSAGSDAAWIDSVVLPRSPTESRRPASLIFLMYLLD